MKKEKQVKYWEVAGFKAIRVALRDIFSVYFGPESKKEKHEMEQARLKEKRDLSKLKRSKMQFKNSKMLKYHFQQQFVQKLACPEGINRAKWW